MKKTFEVINRMRDEGVIDRYAVAGAVAATFYLEPLRTLDIVIFGELFKPDSAHRKWAN